MRRLSIALTWIALLTLPVFADCKDEVAKAFEKQREAGSFRMVTNMVSEQGPIQMTVDYILPGRMHQTVKVATNPQGIETILIADQAWTTEGKGWVPVPAEFVDELTKQMNETVVAPPASLLNYACLGTQTLDGAEVRAYRAEEGAAKTIPGVPAQNPPERILYLDAQTGLPARNIVALKEKLDKPFFKTVFTYPTDIKIEPPAADAMNSPDATKAEPPAAPPKAQ